MTKAGLQNRKMTVKFFSYAKFLGNIYIAIKVNDYYRTLVVFFLECGDSLLLTFFMEQVHFTWWVIGGDFSTSFCLKINKVEEHHAWRIRSILFNNATFIVYAVGLLYNLI